MRLGGGGEREERDYGVGGGGETGGSDVEGFGWFWWGGVWEGE